MIIIIIAITLEIVKVVYIQQKIYLMIIKKKILFMSQIGAILMNILI